MPNNRHKEGHAALDRHSSTPLAVLPAGNVLPPLLRTGLTRMHVAHGPCAELRLLQLAHAGRAPVHTSGHPHSFRADRGLGRPRRTGAALPA
eukprot:586198-Pelagomonas_calceolata.AAC.1